MRGRWGRFPFKGSLNPQSRRSLWALLDIGKSSDSKSLRNTSSRVIRRGIIWSKTPFGTVGQIHKGGGKGFQMGRPLRVRNELNSQKERSGLDIVAPLLPPYRRVKGVFKQDEGLPKEKSTASRSREHELHAENPKD